MSPLGLHNVEVPVNGPLAYLGGHRCELRAQHFNSWELVPESLNLKSVIDSMAKGKYFAEWHMRSYVVCDLFHGLLVDAAAKQVAKLSCVFTRGFLDWASLSSEPSGFMATFRSNLCTWAATYEE